VAVTNDDAQDRVAESLELLVNRLRQMDDLARRATARAELLRAQRLQGLSYRDIVGGEERPLLVEIVSQMIDVLIDAGWRFRRAQAKALYDEGATMDQIGRLFGVSRQRVSALLATSGPDTDGD
jgi:hypothetical protein